MLCIAVVLKKQDASLAVALCLVHFVCCSLSVQAVQKLKTYELIDCVLVVIDNDMHTQPESDQLTALRAALPLLAPHRQSPTAVLQLNKLRLSDQLAAELTAAAAAGWHWLSVDQLTLPAAPAVVTAKLPVLRRVGLADALTDARLAQLRQCVSQAMQLSVSALALQSALPAGVELPWGTLRVKEPILMADWLEQAELLGGQCKWYIERLRVQLSNEEVRLCIIHVSKRRHASQRWSLLCD